MNLLVGTHVGEVVVIRAPAVAAVAALEVAVHVAVARERDRAELEFRRRGNLRALLGRHGRRERRGLRAVHDAEGTLAAERGLVDRRERHDRLGGVRIVVEERLARGGLLEGLRGLRHLRLEPHLLLGSDGRRIHDTHLREQHLELGHLIAGHVLDHRRRLGRLAPRALRHARRARLRSVPDRSGLGLAVLGALGVAAADERGVGVVPEGDALALLLVELELLHLVLNTVHVVANARAAAVLVVALGHARLVDLAALVARLQAGAELGRVSRALAVSALGGREGRAAGLPVLAVLNPVRVDHLVGLPRVEAELTERLLGNHLANLGIHLMNLRDF